MNIFLIAGNDLHQQMTAVLQKNGFGIAGHEYTMDAAVISLKKKRLTPDLIIINGLAQASGAAEGVINRNRSMLLKLKEIRMAAPTSRILLLLPGETPPEVVRNVVSLGVYDVHQASRFDEPTLVGWINNPMTIAHFDFQTGQVPDNASGEIRYEEDGGEVRKKGILKGRVKGPWTEKGFSQKASGNLDRLPGSGRKRPLALLGIGDARIEGWIEENFADQAEVLPCFPQPEEIKRKIEEVSPDILVLMRQGAMGGVPGADALAEWAAGRVPALLLILGELDGPGRAMLERAGQAGIHHIIYCQEGGYISGDELVYMLTGIIREMRETGGHGDSPADPPAGGAGKRIRAIIEGAGVLGKVVKQSAEAKAKRAGGKKGPGLKMKFKLEMKKGQGLSLSENEGPPRETDSPGNSSPTTIVPGGLLAVVSPWKPNLAGRLAAQAARMLSEAEGCRVSYVAASKDSTGAIWLDIPEEELMMSDWRVPGSSYPIGRDNVSVFAVDPSKDLGLGGELDLADILRAARKAATYTVIDFAGDMAAAAKGAHQGRAVVLVVLPGNDPVELRISSLWLRNFMEGKRNIVTGIDLRGVPRSIPEGIRPRVVIRNNPADALAAALKKSGDEFIWN